MQELDELKELLLHGARGIWKHRWISILIAWLVLIGGVISVDQIKNRYKAETKVYIDSTSVLKPLLRGLAIESDFEEKVRLMVRQLLSRPNLERAIRTMDMDLDVHGQAEMEELIERVRKRVDISAIKRSGIYSITYSDTDRLRAKKMTQTLLNIFVEDTLGNTAIESGSAIEFLDKQIAKYESLLQEAEKRREEFKRKNIGLMPQDGKTYYSQLQNSERLLEQAELTLSELKNRRNRIKAQILELKSSEVRREPIVKTSLDERIEEQENRLDEMLLLYTDEHPDVINAQQVLSTLRERKQAEVKQSVVTRSILDNPVYQELQILLSKTEADISSVSARVKSLEKKRSELKKLVDIVPGIEAELQRLNRDYQVHQQNYTEFVSRREQAKISDDAESGSDQVKFRIIEPPYVPLRPDFPNRVLLDLGILILAIGAGYGVGFLISLLRPVFYNQKDLMTYIGGSVLGAINKFDTPNVLARRRKNLVLFCVANIFFFCTAGTLIYLHSQGILILSQLHSMVI